jgi:phage baseplate assembly protein W
MGIDLNVVQFFAALDSSSMDLVYQAVPMLGPVDEYLNATAPFVAAESAASWGANVTARGLLDLDLQTDRHNLAQALVMRLITPVGALAALGHPAYGSRLSQLIGRNKTDALRGLCRAYVLEAIAQEPRVEPTAIALDFDILSESSSEFRFTLVVQPIQGGNPLSLGLSVTL